MYNLIRELGGYAEIVSDMEYTLDQIVGVGTVAMFAIGGLYLPYLCIKKISGEDLSKVEI